MVPQRRELKPWQKLQKYKNVCNRHGYAKNHQRYYTRI